MRFDAELEATGGNTTGFRVPEDVVDGLAAGRRPKVVVTVGKHSWRSSLAARGGQMWLGVSAANRASAAMVAGTSYAVDLVVDDQPRTVEVPEELAREMRADPGLRAAWDSLSHTAQREQAEPIAAAKGEDTRARRVQKALTMLRERAAR